jgi:hypothetical protein
VLQLRPSTGPVLAKYGASVGDQVRVKFYPRMEQVSLQLRGATSQDSTLSYNDPTSSCFCTMASYGLSREWVIKYVSRFDQSLTTYEPRIEVLCRSEHSAATSASVATRVAVMLGVLCVCVSSTALCLPGMPAGPRSIEKGLRRSVPELPDLPYLVTTRLQPLCSCVT